MDTIVILILLRFMIEPTERQSRMLDAAIVAAVFIKVVEVGLAIFFRP